jgi:hypothetical protein
MRRPFRCASASTGRCTLTGLSYSLINNISSIKWFQDYTNAFNAISFNGGIGAAHHIAKDVVDYRRLQPGTAACKEKLKQLQEINNWYVGAA